MTDRLRTLIVDDEPGAVRRLRHLCAALPRVEVVGTADDGETALRAIDGGEVDLVFLDISMPGVDGMEVASRLATREVRPMIVFVTAHDSFAVAAFVVNAVGYLLKPVDPAALSAVVARLADIARPAATLADAPALWVPQGSKLVRLEHARVDWIAGEDDYIRLHVGTRSHLVSMRLYALEEQLDPVKFVRVHRSAIVRRAAILALQHDGGGNWSVTLSSNQRVPVGRSYLETLRNALGLS